jgi:arginine decarboxylase
VRAQAIRAGLETNLLARGLPDKNPVYCVITNCTYDGLCYNAKAGEERLGSTVDRLHWDEAW